MQEQGIVTKVDGDNAKAGIAVPSNSEKMRAIIIGRRINLLLAGVRPASLIQCGDNGNRPCCFEQRLASLSPAWLAPAKEAS